MDESHNEWLQVDFGAVNGYLRGVEHVGRGSSNDLEKPAKSFRENNTRNEVGDQQLGLTGDHRDLQEATPSQIVVTTSESPTIIYSPPIITGIATQGRYDNQRGVEYTTYYVLKYKVNQNDRDFKKYVGSEHHNQVRKAYTYF